MDSEDVPRFPKVFHDDDDHFEFLPCYHANKHFPEHLANNHAKVCPKGCCYARENTTLDMTLCYQEPVVRSLRGGGLFFRCFERELDQLDPYSRAYGCPNNCCWATNRTGIDLSYCHQGNEPPEDEVVYTDSSF